MKKLYALSITYFFAWAIFFYGMKNFNFSGDYVTSITAAAVGYFAYLVFALGQINQLVSAAKILVLDIRNAEDAIQGVRSGASHATWSKVAVVENNWSKLNILLKKNLLNHFG